MKKKRVALALLPLFWPNLPPLNLAALKGYLKEKSIVVDALDFNNYFYTRSSSELRQQWHASCNKYLEDNILSILEKDSKEAFGYMLERLLAYDILGFSCYKSNFGTVTKVINILKAKNPKIKIILGGPEVARQFFKYKGKLPDAFYSIADFVVVGEGELPLLRYLTGLKNETKVADFWELPHLKDLPAPDYGDFDFEAYPKKNSVSVIYSRGCCGKCSFCSERLLYKKFRVCSSDAIIKEMRYQKSKGIEHFIFHDSLINGNLKLLEELCDGIIKGFGFIKWEAQMAIRKDMPDRLLSKIKKSGCYHLFVGLESGSSNTLAAMNKGFSSGDAVLFFKKLKNAGLSFGISIIAGYPTETEEDFADSLKFVIDNKNLIPKIEQVNPFVYYDGTDVPPYPDDREAARRTRFFIDRLRNEGFKLTNAFMFNLIER